MARIVPQHEYVTFIPAAFGQRDDFDEGKDKTPIAIEMRWLTAREIREYEKAVVTKVRPDGQISSPNGKEVERKLLGECIRSVKNYTVRGTEITNGEQLYDVGEIEVTKEVLKALLNGSVLEAGRRDLSSSQSAG